MDVHRWGQFYKTKRRGTIFRKLYWCVSGQGWSDAGEKAGLKARVLQVAPHVNFTLCIIHRESLASKTLEPELKHILDIAIKMVHYIKTKLYELRDKVRIFLIEHWSQLADHITDPDWLIRLAYLCEKTFSALTNIKNKYRAQVKVENNLRVTVSKNKAENRQSLAPLFWGSRAEKFGNPWVSQPPTFSSRLVNEN